MIKRAIFWFNCARLYSLPMTIMSWLVIFLWALKENGNIINGIIALIGISFAQLATNLFDDYMDYKILSKDEKYISFAHKQKCFYLRDGSVTPETLLKVIGIFCAISFITGVILTLTSGWTVVFLAFIGGLIVLSYPKFSVIGLGDLLVIAAFGPLLFEGVYYVMTGSFSFDVLILSFSVAMMTEVLLYAHMIMDYDSDKISHKKTLCGFFKNKNDALKLLCFFYLIAYLLIAILAVRISNYYLFATFLTIPLAVSLYSHLKTYNSDKTNMPKIHWWNYPLDNWKYILKEGNETFYFRFFQARNLMMYFSLLLCIAILL